MSNDQSIQDKVARPQTSEGRAQRSLESLKAAWGYRVIGDGDAKLPPLVRIGTMAVTFWRHKSGTGQAAMYEQVDSPNVAPTKEQ